MKLVSTFLLFLLVHQLSWSQPSELRFSLDKEGKRYIKATFLNQAWMRYNESNPGTLVLGEARDYTFDIGLRRTRAQLFGQVGKRLFIYTQFGMNNFNYLSQNSGNRKLQAFFHDALGEFIVSEGKNPLKLGAGLTICNGLSRFSQPSISTILTLDVPVFAQATVDQIDEFSRKLSVYARGQWGKLDYRFVLSDPFPVTTAGIPVSAPGSDAQFAALGHHLQGQTLLIWNFLEREQHTTPYMTGTHLGKKRIFNIEAGAIYQKSATWTASPDTLFHPLMLWSLAAYLDIPLSKEKGTAFSAFAGYFHTDYGKNYIRNNGPMNPGQAVGSSASFNGPGSAYPMFGTGSVVYAQAGYLLRQNFLGDLGTLLPYVAVQNGFFDKLKDPVMVMDAGVNWLVEGHQQKITLAWQNRPVFDLATHHVSSHRNMLILQYQVSI